MNSNDQQMTFYKYENPILNEFMKSEIHECEKNDGDIYIYITPDKVLKYIINSTSTILSSTGTEIKCCPFCGFEVIQ